MPILIASEVMDLAAAAMNDVDKTNYTYEVQIPYLKMALQELQEIYELNNLQTVEDSSEVLSIPAASNGNPSIVTVKFNVMNAPRLPDNLIEPQRLWERNTDINPWIPMVRKDFIPANLIGIQTNQFIYWIWQRNELKFLSSNQVNDIRIDGVYSLFPKYVVENTIIPVINGLNFLQFRVAGLLSELIENNQARAGVNNSNASLSLDRITGITIKSKQNIVARRRPFRQAYKRITSY